MSMNTAEIRATARQMTISAIMPSLMENEAVKFADGSFAILQRVEDTEVWTEVTVKTKNWKATKTSEVFDPYIKAAEWEEERKIKIQDKEIKEKEKQKKIEAKSRKDT